MKRIALYATTIGALLALGGCESTDSSAASSTFRVQNISSSGTGQGTGGESSVRIKLSSSGNLAEADLASIVAYVKIVAKREATKRQAMIAAQRARAAQARMAPGQRKTRYLAVETERSAPLFDTQPASYVEGAAPASTGAAPKFERSVMLWDTQTQSLVGNAVYDINSTPAVGKAAQFETYTATYVGTGGS